MINDNEEMAVGIKMYNSTCRVKQPCTLIASIFGLICQEYCGYHLTVLRQ